MSAPRAFLLVILVVAMGATALPVPAMAQETAAGWLVVEDPAGDPMPGAEPPAPLPVGPWPQIDIVSVRVGPDTVSAFDVVVAVSGRTDPFTTATEAVALGDVACDVIWGYNGDTEITYALQFSVGDVFEEPGGDPGELRSVLMRRTAGADGRLTGEAWADGADVRWDASLPGFVGSVKKLYAKVFPDERPPALGDELTGLTAQCRTDVLGVRVADYAPDGGGAASGSYAFQDPGPGSVVRLSFPDEVFEMPEGEDLPRFSPQVIDRTLGVASGETSVLPFRMENLAGTTQSVSIQAGAYGATGEPLAWNLTVARSVELRTGEVRTANVIVRPPQGLVVGETGSIRIDIETAAGDPGRAERAFVVVPVFTPENNRLRFHSMHDPTSETPADALLDRARPSWDVTMSLQESLPDWDNGPVPVDALLLRTFRFNLEPLARPLLLAEDGIMALDLHFEGQGTVLARLVLQDDTTGAFFQFDAPVEAGQTTHVERLVLSDGPLIVPGGSEITGLLSFELDASQGPSVDVVFDPTKSGLTLPVLPDAGLTRVITDGRYVPSVYLEVGEVAEVFVNPGKTYAYALQVANEGAESDEISLTVEFGTPGWQHGFIPGARFRIDSGNATAVGIEIVAPSGLAENTKVPITVLATSKFDPLAVSRLQLAATVQKGIEVAERRYTEREGALQPVDESREDVPAPPVVPLLLVAAVGVGLLRRRRL